MVEICLILFQKLPTVFQSSCSLLHFDQQYESSSFSKYFLINSIVSLFIFSSSNNVVILHYAFYFHLPDNEISVQIIFYWFSFYLVIYLSCLSFFYILNKNIIYITVQKLPNLCEVQISNFFFYELCFCCYLRNLSLKQITKNFLFFLELI